MDKESDSYYSYSISWGNPYREPPKGLPRTIVEVTKFERGLDGRIKDKFHAILDRFHAKGIFGFNICHTYFDNKPRRRWSEEAKMRNRRKRLLKRLQKKYSIPGLLQSAYDNAIAKKPQYYGVNNETPTM